MTVWKAREIQDSEFEVKNSGLVSEAKGDNLFIGCGKETILQIDELQLEGKKRMATRDFLNGIKMSVGEKLGA